MTRLLAKDKPVDVGFTAHPSGVTKEELLAVDAPISIAYAGELLCTSHPKLGIY